MVRGPGSGNLFIYSKLFTKKNKNQQKLSLNRKKKPTKKKLLSSSLLPPVYVEKCHWCREKEKKRREFFFVFFSFENVNLFFFFFWPSCYFSPFFCCYCWTCYFGGSGVEYLVDGQSTTVIVVDFDGLVERTWRGSKVKLMRSVRALQNRKREREREPANNAIFF